VLRKASDFGEGDPRILTRWLEYEAQAKPDAERRPLIDECSGRLIDDSWVPFGS
jgi:hypothetical protein